MKKCSFLWAAFAGTFFYVLITIFCGRDGFFAQRQQIKQKEILSVSAEKIQKINDTLNLEYAALEKDMDVIGSLAKKLGYVASGDKIVIINGLYLPENFICDPGTPVKAEEPEFLPEWFGKICGIIAFLAVYFYCISLDFKKVFFKKKKDKVFVGGIPVYDLPQV